MTNGGMLLIGLTFVAITDVFMAFRFRKLADQADEIGPAPSSIDPANARRMASFMLAFSPVLVVVAAVIAFGIVPVGGIDPIKF